MSQPILFRTLPQVAIGAVFISLAATAEAVTYYKANNTTSLTNLGSWWLDATGTTAATDAPINTTSPSAVCIWNNLVTTANTINVANVGIQTIQILDPGGLVTLASVGAAQTMTVGSGGGIDMTAATQDLTIDNVFYRASTANANVAVKVKTGRTLTFGSTATFNVRNNSGGVTYNFNNDGVSTGTIKIAGNFQPTNIVLGGGVLELNSPGGSTGRIGTPSTTINAGKLVISNTSGSATGGGTVAINNTATLAGNGLMTSVVSVASGGTVIPGEGVVGSITAGGLNLAAGSTIKWEAVDTTTSDLITVSNADGLVINGGTVELYNVGTNTPFTGTGTYNLFAFNGTIGGAGISSLAVAESSKISGQTYTFGVSGNFITLTIEVGSRPQSFWNINNSGTWATPANWTSNGVPNAVSAIANLGGAQGTPITQPRTVTLGAAATVGVLRFNSAQSFTVAGASTLTFDDGIAGATLQVVSGSHTISAPLGLTDNGLTASVENAASTLTLGGQIDGSGGLAKSGAGTLIIAADAYHAGTTTVGGGTLQVGNGGASGSINGPIANSSALRFNRSDDVTLNYATSGTGSVTYAGTGKSTLNAASTYSGPTTISAGTVEIADGLALQNSTLTHSTTGGNLTVSEFLTSVTLGGLTGDRSFPLTNTIGDPVSLTVGQNNASTSYPASTAGTGAAFTKAGTGTFTLTGTHTFNAAATINAGVLALDTGSSFTAGSLTTTAAGAKLRVNGGSFHATGTGSLVNASAGLELVAGSVAIDGAVSNPANVASGAFFINASGGTLNAGSMSISRGALNLGTTEPAAGSTTAGLYVHGAAATITNTLLIGNNANSSVSARVDSGSLTVNGATTVAINSPDRWSILDIGGGTFTSTDVNPAGGVLLGGNAAGQVVMHVHGTGTVAKAERFQFGQAALGGTSILRLAGGELYVGSGGMNLGSTGPITAQLKLEGGTLGALANSTSNVPVNLNGPAVVTGSGPANEPRVITLTGPATGTGSLTKTGAGTVIFSSATSNFSGPTTVSAGTLGFGGQTSGLVTVNSGTTFAPQGLLSANAGAAINGALSLTYDSSSSPRVPRITSSSGPITLGATSTLAFSGSGTLTGSTHVILKSLSGGVTGTFASVTGLPSGFTLNYAYDDDGNGATPPVVAIINPAAVTPFESWIQTYVGGGSVPANQAGATDDPDRDGLDNITEFAFDGDPGDGKNNGRIYGLAQDGGDVDTQKQLLLTVAVRTGTSFTAGTPATGSNPDVGYTIEGSTGLTTFATGVSVESTPVAPPNPPALHSGWEWKTFSLDGSNGLTGKGFLRAKASAAP
ncbi:beta strand repeat-containing protein [Luteolibacter soli]|uniref:Autotransporter-associated beta strand repeat-containing protein n=1 Tax=Luteolibacter soli TaxID=3135280 RepID=A0ABU9ART4_9BACT